MDTLLKHNKEMEEIFEIKVSGLKVYREGSEYVEVKDMKYIKSFITQSNKSLLKKIAKGEIVRLNELLKILDWHEPYRVCLEDQLTHWQQVLQDLER